MNEQPKSWSFKNRPAQRPSRETLARPEGTPESGKKETGASAKPATGTKRPGTKRPGTKRPTGTKKPTGTKRATAGIGADPLGERALLARIGPLDRLPTLAIEPARLRSLHVDHRAGFLLSQVDGRSTLEMIIDVSGMPRADAMLVLLELIEQGILRVD